MQCNLCKTKGAISLGANGKREFYRCLHCKLIFVSPESRLSAEDEKSRYANHDNGADNPEYRAYLTAVSHEIDRIPLKDPTILDFGCGKEYVLTRILRERGFSSFAYDPTYTIGLENLSRRFDVIILCETIEHLRNIDEELRLLRKLCKPEGYIFIRTRLAPHECDILKWWYAIDPTHIVFFGEETFSYMANILGASVFYSDGVCSVIIGPEKTAI